MSLREFINENPAGTLAKALHVAEKAHVGQKRKTGEPYIVHPIAVGEILFAWRLDEATIAAGLLHDTVEDTLVSLEDIRKEFGNTVAFLVDGVTKLGRIKYRGDEETAENLRKMIIAISQDLRVVFIKLADRLNNMRTLSALPPMKQKRIALETEEIYAPLAYRMGMNNVSGELQDLAFPYLFPRENEWLKEKVGDRYEDRIKYAEKVAPLIQEALRDQGIKSEIQFRAKRWSSLYKKLLYHQMDLEKIHDLVAIRLIVQNVEECYAALGIIHGLWVPLPGKIKDYIAMPKPNGYKSLHTTVIGPDGKFIEIQIRTREMHEEDENGIAAHWLYKQSKDKAGNKLKAAEEIKWVEQLRRWQENISKNEVEPQEFIEALKVDFFKNRIFVLTPKGEVIDLPSGSTPVDFAYNIHTQIGNECVAAKVNGGHVSLDYILKSGDMVQILTQKNKKPAKEWLDFVKSSVARNHIRLNMRRKNSALKGQK